MARRGLEDQLVEARATAAKANARVAELEKRVSERRQRLFARAEKSMDGRVIREDELAAALELVLSGAVARSAGAGEQDEPEKDDTQNTAKEDLGAGARAAKTSTTGHAPETTPSTQMSIDDVMGHGGQ